jgi:hypothetical protein
MEFVTGAVGHAGERMVNPRLEPGVALGDALCDFLRFSVFAAFQLSQFLFLIPQGKASLAGGPGVFPILALLDGRHIRTGRQCQLGGAHPGVGQRKARANVAASSSSWGRAMVARVGARARSAHGCGRWTRIAGAPVALPFRSSAIILSRASLPQDCPQVRRRLGQRSSTPPSLSQKAPSTSDNFIKRQLKPILKKLGLDGAAHAFRHGNASLLDHLAAPMKVRQDRLGHADPRTTMGYTHVIGDDHRKMAEQLGGFFAQVRLNLPKKESGSGDRDSQAAV